jgi:C-terminal processing protease CtpA/Prc
VDWDKEFSRAIERSYLDRSKTDHLITLQKFTAPLNDGHISVSGVEEVKNKFIPPIAWEWVVDQLVVIRTLNGVDKIKVGDIITHINGQTAKEYFKEINSTISAGTEGWLNYRAQYISLMGPQDSKITLTINNTDVDLIRDRNVLNGNPLRIKNREEHRIIEDSIHYLNIDVISMKGIHALLPKLSKSYAIICDLRGYPKGNHGFINHLLKNNDTTSSWMKVPQIIYPDHEKVGEYSDYNWIDMMKPIKPYLGDKKIVFIINGSAISYAESYMGYIEGYELATIVGQPTAGTNGNVNSFSLPGGYTISWTGMKVLKHDGSQHHGIGVLPNVYVNKTIQGIKEGRDEFLEKAIGISKQESTAANTK